MSAIPVEGPLLRPVAAHRSAEDEEITVEGLLAHDVDHAAEWVPAVEKSGRALEHIDLNAAAVADANGAAGGLWGIGGAITTLNGGDEGIFGSTHGPLWDTFDILQQLQV